MKQIAILLFCYTLLTNSISAQVLPIDVSFGNDGISKLDILSGYKVMKTIKTGPSDQIIAAGSSQGFQSGSTHFTVVQYLENGEIDPGFGQNGAVYTTIGDASTIHDFEILTDGRILAAGSCYVGDQQQIALARYLPNGVLDVAFGNGGEKIIPTDATAEIKSVAIQADGKVLLAGYLGDLLNTDFLLIRLSPDGTVDPNFGDDGFVVAQMPSTYPRGEAVKVLVRPNGKIMLAGNYSTVGSLQGIEIFMAQFLANGDFDTTFGQNGIWSDGVPEAQLLADAVLASDGRVIASASRRTLNNSAYNLLTLAVLPNGSTDNSYGDNGYRVIYPSGRSGFAGAGILLLPNDNLLIGATGLSDSPNEPNQDVLLIQLSPDGQLSPAFNQTGYGFYPLLGYFSAVKDIAIQQNGRILNLVEFLGTSNNTAVFGFKEAESVAAVAPTSKAPAAQVSPNPWVSGGELQYVLPEATEVTITLYDSFGRSIRLLQRAHWQEKGAYSLRLAIDDLPAGHYRVGVSTNFGQEVVGVVR